MLGYIRELIDFVFKDSGLTGGAEIQEAPTLTAARGIIDQGFIPDLVMSDYDLGPEEKGPDIFELLREKNPKVFICLMSCRDRVPKGLHDVFIIKTNLQSQIPSVLLQAATGM
jgi:hypothetical protein